MRTSTVDYEVIDHRMARDPGLLDAKSFREYCKQISSHPLYAHMAKIKNFSMLHVDTLLLLRLCALSATGGILEIGPYIGGSTVAIASGVRDGAAAKFVSIEPGGRYDHPEYPSRDILADLKANLEAQQLSSYVHVIEGTSDSPQTREEAFRLLGDSRISFIFIDADGEIGRDVDIYCKLFRPGCLLAFDDYSAPGAVEKELRVKSIVEEEVAKGRFEPFGVFGWGTWFGRYRA